VIKRYEYQKRSDRIKERIRELLASETFELKKDVCDDYDGDAQ
jgi:hypothetical protein